MLKNWLITSQGDLINLANIRQIILPAALDLVIAYSDTHTKTYTYASNALAVAAYDEIIDALKSVAEVVDLRVFPPTIASILSNTGPIAGGTVVTVTGTNFDPTMRVFIGDTVPTNVECTLLEFLSETQIRCVTPSGAILDPGDNPYYVRILKIDGTWIETAALFTYIP